MEIEHIAIWTDKLEEMKAFYEIFFKAKSNEKYVNNDKAFESYFLTFDSGARLELMRKYPMESIKKEDDKTYSGYAHMAFLQKSQKEVDDLTQTLKDEGIKHIDGPRRTGDGYYEACFLDPDGNRIELVAK